MSTRRTITIESGTLLVLGAIGLWGGLSSYLGMDARMQSSWLKPGVYVSVLSAGLMLTALAYAYLGFRATSPAPREAIREVGVAASDAESGSSGRVLAVFGIVAIYAFLIPLLGYVLATLFFLLAQFRTLGVGSWRLNAVISLAVTALFYVIFIHYGGLEFPRGGLFD